MSGKYMSPGSPEYVEAENARAAAAKKNERAEWAQLYRIYERCVEIAEKVWTDRLDAAQITQQQLTEEMRDRAPEIRSKPSTTMGTLTAATELELVDRSIPVPLFTPRDRLQFLKEATATLFIEAGSRNRNLTVLFAKEVPDAPAEPQAPEGAAVEAASGADEGALDQEAAELAEQGSGPATG